MNAARNIPAALATATAAMADAPQTAMGLRSALAQCRLRNPAALAQFTDAEAHELLEAAMASEPLPGGAVGEAVLAYLTAMRRGVNPVPFAVSALRSFGADDKAGFTALADWVQASAERAAARADALQAELNGRTLQ